MGKNYTNLNLSLFPPVFCLVTFFRMFFKAQIKNQHKILLFLHRIFILLRKKFWVILALFFKLQMHMPKNQTYLMFLLQIVNTYFFTNICQSQFEFHQVLKFEG
jgi:hypothetical protein